jgi:hypothetical protein
LQTIGKGTLGVDRKRRTISGSEENKRRKEEEKIRPVV